MNGYRTIMSAVLLATVLATAPAFAAESLEERAARDIANQIVDALPTDDVHLRLLAVTDIDGDRGGLLTRALNVALSERTSFVLIEKDNIEKVFAEQGWQLSDVVNPEARVQMGEMLAAEGILFGSVLEWSDNLREVTIRTHVQLDDVQRGSIVFAREFSATRSAPERALWIAGVAIVVALALLLALVYRVRIRKGGEKIERGVDHRLDAMQQIRRAQRNLGDAREKVRTNGSDELAQQIKGLEGDVDRLRLSIESAPTGRVLHRTGVGFAQNDFENDRLAVERLRIIVGYCDRLFEQAQADDRGELEKLIAETTNAIRDTHTFFTDRKVG